MNPLNGTPSSSVGNQGSKIAAVDSYLQHANFSTSVHPTVQTASLAARQSAVQRGWQPQYVKDVAARDAIEQTVKAHKQRFEQALQDYQAVAPSKYKPDVTLDASHNWGDVLQAVESLQVVKQKRSDFWGQVLQKFRALGEQSLIFKQWLELLPTQSQYFSVLCGGLKLIFGALERMKKVRDYVLDALAELPTLLMCTDRTLDAFAADLQLHQCGRLLMSETFQSLHCIVQELRRSALSTGVKSFGLQQGYAKELESSLEAVRKTSARFKQIAETCQYETVSNVEKVVTTTQNQIPYEHNVTRDVVVQASIGNAAYIDKQLAARNEEMKSHLKSFGGSVLSEIVNFINSRLDDRGVPMIEAAPSSSNLSLVKDKSRDLVRVRQSICHTLNYDPEVIVCDISDNLSRIWSGTIRTQDRVQVLTADPLLTSWLLDPSSNALFVNGNHEQSEGAAPTSFVCAKIVDAMRSAAQVSQSACTSMCLCFFCSDHVRSNVDELTSPDGMLRALIGQLLLMHEDFKAAKIKKMVDNADLYDVQHLWQIFEELIFQLPSSVAVFCILDGITAFEVVDWRKEAMWTVEQMLMLSGQLGEEDRVFKILLTSPASSRFLDRGFDRSQIINMPDRIEHFGGFSERAWAVSECFAAVGNASRQS